MGGTQSGSGSMIWGLVWTVAAVVVGLVVYHMLFRRKG